VTSIAVRDAGAVSLPRRQAGRRSSPRWLAPSLLAFALAAPLLCAYVLWSFHDGELSGPGAWPGCAFLAVTGIPCPGCGTLRSVYLGLHGDPAFLDYNPVGALAVGLTWLCGLSYLAASVSRSGGGPLWSERIRYVLSAHPVAVTLVTLALGAAAWAVALVNVQTIGAA
jgi:hypothetical protein